MWRQISRIKYYLKQIEIASSQKAEPREHNVKSIVKKLR